MKASQKYPDPYKHIVLTQQFTPDYLHQLFELTDRIKSSPKDFVETLRGKVVATLFYEPSTRTRFSFESAIHRLGGSVITTENAKEFSSASKGETIEDSIRVISAYADFIVMRHYQDDASKRALTATQVPLINAGSGKSQHPTQALLDAYTLYEQFGRLDNLHIAVVGDLLRGRTCDSLVYVLSKYPNNTFYFVAPENSRVKQSLREHLEEKGIQYKETDDLAQVLPLVDMLYMTRIQKERFATVEEYEEAKGTLILDAENIKQMKQEAIIMHPLPRVDEITVTVDTDKRARYFEQAANGLWVRMALLKMLNDTIIASQ
jgi:aspartate carbamoyltransferase catalytic subunit